MKHRIKAIGELLIFTSLVISIPLGTITYDSEKKAGNVSAQFLKLPVKIAMIKWGRVMKQNVQQRKTKLQIACVKERDCYEKYSGALYGLILKFTSDLPLACVLLEESFTAIYKGVSDFDAKKGKLFSWMVRIVIRQCQEHFNLSNSIVTQKMKNGGIYQ